MTLSYADIILPFSVRGRFTYRIPAHLIGKLVPGMRVKVQFGNRNHYSGIVSTIHDKTPAYEKVKEILSLQDNMPVVNEIQLKLWNWISEYYMCTEGEVMKAALPSGKSIDEYKPRYEICIEPAARFNEAELNNILDGLKKAPKQFDILAGWISLAAYDGGTVYKTVRRTDLLRESGSNLAALNGLLKKRILKTTRIPVSRIVPVNSKTEPPNDLSEAQQQAYNSIKRQLQEKDIVLLHGVTSSGKTEIYIHFIEEQLLKGKQVLYLLPEIALTTQIIQRLKKHFGDLTGIYHSRLSDPERIEIWKNVAVTGDSSGCRLILGVRSSVFLPFSNLGLVIIDEEHDGSYKQQDPAPRYHARDTAIMMSFFHKAKTVLGSASPSIESYHNALSGKYGLTELVERFGRIRLPEIIIANTLEASRRKLMVSHFTPELLHSMDDTLGKGEQVILFQNRRGFSPYLQCSECGWIPTCIQCAVNLTYHKSRNRLVCHYCGFSMQPPHNCSVCNSTGLLTRGFGTEKIEEEIRMVFPSARVARMDQDTTRSGNSFKRIIKAFEEKQIDILIGTQMISKGLDFDNLTLVGILNADNLLNYPDFRAHERSFQLMEQVSGRAGRRNKPGKVLIQTSDPAHRIVRLVIRHDYRNMFNLQSEERKTFNYPPFCRMIKISLKHKDRAQLAYFADLLGNELKKVFGERVLGPEEPLISRVQLWYIKVIILKIEKTKSPALIRSLVYDAIEKTEAGKNASSLRLALDVDPY